MNYHVLHFDFNKIANLWFLFSFYLSLNKDYFICNFVIYHQIAFVYSETRFFFFNFCFD